MCLCVYKYMCIKPDPDLVYHSLTCYIKRSDLEQGSRLRICKYIGGLVLERLADGYHMLW